MKIGALIASVLGAVVLFLKTALGDGGIENWEWLHIGTLVLACVGVWLQPNTTVLKTAKTWVIALAAGTVLLESFVSDGVSLPEWIDVLIAVLTAGGVLVASTPTLTPLHAVASVDPASVENQRRFS